MKRITHRVLWFCLVSIICFAQVAMATPQAENAEVVTLQDSINRDAEDFVRAYVVVADPGSMLYAAYGHTCLHLVCEAYNLDYCFSYESEQWDTQPAALLAGKLKMGMLAIPFEDYVATYAADSRAVRQYELQLPIAVKRELWRVLDEEMMKGMDRPFDVESNGCTATCITFVRKALDTIPIIYAPWGDEYKKTTREISYDYAKVTWGRFWAMTIMSYGIGDDASIPKEKQIAVPVQLVEVWQKATVNGEPLLSDYAEVVQPISKPVESTWLSPMIFAILCLVLAIVHVIWNKDYIGWGLLVLYGLFSVLITYLVLFCKLPGADGWNWLIIPFNVLPLMLWKWRIHWAVIYAGIIAIWCVGMLFAPHQLVELTHILMALAFGIMILKTNIKERKWL